MSRFLKKSKLARKAEQLLGREKRIPTIVETGQPNEPIRVQVNNRNNSVNISVSTTQTPAQLPVPYASAPPAQAPPPPQPASLYAGLLDGVQSPEQPPTYEASCADGHQYPPVNALAVHPQWQVQQEQWVQQQQQWEQQQALVQQQLEKEQLEQNGQPSESADQANGKPPLPTEPTAAAEQTLVVDGKQFTNRSAPLLREVRAKLREAFAQQSHLYYEQDMQKALEDDWYLKRYLLARRRNVPATVQMVLNCFQFRKQQGFRDFEWNYFPLEGQCLGALFAYAPDREGNTTVYMRICMVYKEEVLQTLVKQFAGKYLVELEDRLTGPITCVVDFTGTSWANADLDLLFFTLNVLNRYMPSVVRRVLILELPWIFRTVFKAIQRFLPGDQGQYLEVVSRQELIDRYVALENLPDYLGGHCQQPYRGWAQAAPGSQSCIEFGIKNYPHYTVRQMTRLARIFLPFLESEGHECERLKSRIDLYDRLTQELGKHITFEQLMQRYPQLKPMEPEQRDEFLAELIAQQPPRKQSLRRNSLLVA